MWRGPPRSLEIFDPKTLEMFQGVEIGVVGNVGQMDHTHTEFGRGVGSFLKGNSVFLVDAERIEVGQDAQALTACPLLQKIDAVFEQCRVPPEAIDDESTNDLRLGGLEQVEGPDDGGEDATAVDVGNENGRGPDRSRELQIDDIPITEVDLGSAAGAFQNDGVEAARQPLVSLESLFEKE